MKIVVLSLMMLGATSAFANEAADDQVNRQVFQSATTRAAVQAEYLTARSQGTLPVTSEAASLQVLAPTYPAARNLVRKSGTRRGKRHAHT